jgi:hypothetical protein
VSERSERLLFLADDVPREASYLAQTDGRLIAHGCVPVELDGPPGNPDLAERVDAFVARFGRLQDALAGAQLPRSLKGLLAAVGSMLDKLDRAEGLAWIALPRIGSGCTCFAPAGSTHTCANCGNSLMR